MEKEALLIELYQSGLSLMDASLQANLSHCTGTKILKANDIFIRPNIRRVVTDVPVDIEEVYKAHDSGLSMSDIARQFGMRYSRVLRVIKKRGKNVR